MSKNLIDIARDMGRLEVVHVGPTLASVRAHAASLGLVLEVDHIDDQTGYWMVDPKTGEGPWEDENFSTSLAEVAGKLTAIEIERNEGENA